MNRPPGPPPPPSGYTAAMNVGRASGDPPTVRGGGHGAEHESAPCQATSADLARLVADVAAARWPGLAGEPSCETCGDYGLVEVSLGDVLVDIPCSDCAASDNWMTEAGRGK